MLWRVPRLLQIVLDIGICDPRLRCLRLRTARQQKPPRSGEQCAGGGEHLDATHAWHLLIHEQEHHRVPTEPQVPQEVESGLPSGRENLIPSGVLKTQVALDRFAHPRIVVHGHQAWAASSCARDRPFASAPGREGAITR